MGKCDNLYLLIEDIEGLMESILISGFNVVNTGVLDNIKQVYENCERVGLSFAAEALKHIYKAQEKKRHDMNYNCEEIMVKYFLLNKYIEAIKDKLNIKKAKEYMEINKGETT
ncbi:hypothetical protein [Clostridium tagluense]|uniref:Uncharacterized protein n=1 Tax=Clostridium tagluense TaxID=360422 RepID=A0A401UKE6_9CLOT|nr:hypothetical protein [Clostridium tagluense]MBU3129800.1 hypothetical protein [Clostridium tagluense]MCB2296665.1 hypothetical protein [Clostridium tagluense]GCD10030.1 hypothetical protein Ctaglu_16530 [Clostridium tagluense]